MDANKYVWDLDKAHEDYTKEEREAYFAKLDYMDDSKSRYKVGDIIEFTTGYNNDIRARASVKAVQHRDAITYYYVYNDCYWLPIQDTEDRAITLIKREA